MLTSLTPYPLARCRAVAWLTLYPQNPRVLRLTAAPHYVALPNRPRLPHSTT